MDTQIYNLKMWEREFNTSPLMNPVYYQREFMWMRGRRGTGTGVKGSHQE